MIDYKWQIYPSTGELFTDINASYGITLIAGEEEEDEGQNTTDYIRVSKDCRHLSSLDYMVVYCFDVNYGFIDMLYNDNTELPLDCEFIRICANIDRWEGLTLHATGDITDVSPIYKNDLAINYEREGKNQFLRRKLNGNLTFIGDDYRKLMSFDFETNINIVLLKSANHGDYVNYWEGDFTRADATITFDDDKYVVGVDTSDSYKQILAKYEDEQNLVDLAPVIERVDYFQRPVLQIYVMYTGEVTNIVGGVSWSTDVDESSVSESNITSRWHFIQSGARREVSVLCTDVSAINGIYVGNLPNSPRYNRDNYALVGTLESLTTGYKLKYYTKYVYYAGSQGHSSSTRYFNKYDFISPNGVVVKSVEYDIYDNESKNNIIAQTDDFAVGSVSFTSLRWLRSYVRYLSNQNKQGLQVSYDDPFVDSQTNNYKYIYAPYPSDFEDAVVATMNYSANPTKYGRVEESIETQLGRKLYYTTPDENVKYTPVAKTKWGQFSYWIPTTRVYQGNVDSQGKTKITLNDFYPLWSVINVLAKRIDSRLSFANTPEYSKFLYNQINPVFAFGSYNEYRNIGITQITNISRGEYTRAAEKTGITLKQVLDMLKNLLSCYWWVDEQYRIHIEHISYFANGGKYDAGTPQEVGIDLTSLYNPRNGKRLDFALPECKFQFDESATRYEYEWSLGATEVFNGQPVEIVNRNVDKAKKEEISISRFAADLDYIIGNPSEFSNDGWIIIAPTTTGFAPNEKIETTIEPVEYNKGSYKVQNHALSFAYIQQRYLLYNMSGKHLFVNGYDVEARSLERAMEQQVTIPLGDNEIETDKLVKTKIGNGAIKNATLTLGSRSAKITLRYEIK